jgi:uncharacterized membrane protein
MRRWRLRKRPVHRRRGVLAGLGVGAGVLGAGVYLTRRPGPGNGADDEAVRWASPGSEIAQMRQAWTPRTRCLAATAGSGLVAWAVRRGGPFGLVLGAAGTALLTRAGANRPLSTVLGLPDSARLVDVHKTIGILAPVDVVYGLWTRYENFPRFMSTLKNVEDLGQGRSRWTVDGPGGIPVSWTAEVTRLLPNQLLGWRSLPGAVVPNAGLIRFTPVAEGTRVDIDLSYEPPGGALGLVAAKIFGADAKSQMDEDLRDLKALLEAARISGESDQPAVVSPPRSERIAPVT